MRRCCLTASMSSNANIQALAQLWFYARYQFHTGGRNLLMVTAAENGAGWGGRLRCGNGLPSVAI